MAVYIYFVVPMIVFLVSAFEYNAATKLGPLLDYGL